MKDDFVPRDTTTKAPTDIAGDLGSTAYRWDKAYIKELWVGNPSGAYLKETGTALTAVSATSTGLFTSNSGTAVDVTNLTVSFTTTGRPTVMTIIPDGTANASGFGVTAAGAGADTGSAYLYFNIDGSTAAITQKFGSFALGVPELSPLGISFIDFGRAAGTYTYKIQAAILGTGDAGTVIDMRYAKLLVYEL